MNRSEMRSKVKKESTFIIYGIVGIVMLFIIFQTVADVKNIKNKGTEAVSSTEYTSNTETSQDNGNQGSVEAEEAYLNNMTKDQWTEYFNQKLTELMERFPSGRYWNRADVEEQETVAYDHISDKSCNHNSNGNKLCMIYEGRSNEAYPYKVAGRQSVGFASVLSDIVFGKELSAYSFTDYASVREGDQARIDNDTHTVFVQEKTDEYIIVAEVNENGNDCIISWGRKLVKSQLKGAFYIRRK